MRESRRLPLIVAAALFIENMDSTVISTSLPVIATDLGAEPIALKLALMAYLLALAVFHPDQQLGRRPLRRAADVHGRDRRSCWDRSRARAAARWRRWSGRDSCTGWVAR